MRLPAQLSSWPSRHNVPIALTLFLFVSFLLHGVCVLIFQITYPHSQSTPLRTAEVYFLRADSPEARSMAPLLAASDPALFSPAQFRTGEPGDEISYVASFDARSPSLESAPSVPPSPATFPGPASREVKTRIGAPEGTVLPTKVQLEGLLAGRQLTPPPDVPFLAAGRDFAPAEFLVAVSPEGQILHVFQQIPSKDDVLDNSALLYLKKARLSPSGDTEPVWGTVRFLWGADIQRKTDQP